MSACGLESFQLMSSNQEAKCSISLTASFAFLPEFTSFPVCFTQYLKHPFMSTQGMNPPCLRQVNYLETLICRAYLFSKLSCPLMISQSKGCAFSGPQPNTPSPIAEDGCVFGYGRHVIGRPYEADGPERPLPGY